MERSKQRALDIFWQNRKKNNTHYDSQQGLDITKPPGLQHLNLGKGARAGLIMLIIKLQSLSLCASHPKTNEH